MTSESQERPPARGGILPDGYVIPLSAYAEDPVPLAEILGEIWKGRLRVAGCALALAAIFGVIGFLMSPVYRAQTILSTPAAEGSGLAGSLGELGSIAALAGIQVNEGESGRQEAIALLKSRGFTQAFIRDENLLPVLFAKKWNAESKAWDVDDPREAPTLGDGFYKFDSEVRQVSVDDKTGLVTLSVEWGDRELAARWANLMVLRLNDQMRARAVAETERSLKYLGEELSKTGLVEIQQSIYKVIEGQVKAMTLAKAREEYAFRVIDPALVPDAKDYARPKRALMIVLGFMLGLMGAVAWLVVSLYWRRSPGHRG